LERSPSPGPTFERILEEALPRLRRFVRFHAGSALRSREDVSDLAQSVCAEALAARHRFRRGGRRGLETWLFTLALRKLRDRGRFHSAAKRDPSREVSMDIAAEGGALTELGRGQRTPSRIVSLREEHARISVALRSMPAEYRVVIRLRMAEVDYAEIARRLGRSEGATRKLLNRALRRLESALRAMS